MLVTPKAISAVVCTRNRGASAVTTIASILANAHPNFEVILIDQSIDQNTDQAMAPFRDDPRFHYVHSRDQGVSKARNIAISLAQGSIVAFTDDDCTVPTDWLESIAAVFAAQPRASLLFCNVLAAPHDENTGFIPDYVRTDSRLVRNFWDKCHARGIGAGMAARRDALVKIGGFDELLGPGARFPACEDGDVAIRTLIHGSYIYESHDVSVIHYGFRTWAEGQQLTKRDWVGIGAAYAKLISCGRWSGLVIIFYEGFVIGLLAPIRALLRLKRPQGLRRIVYFLLGLWQGLRTPVNRKTFLYQPAKTARL
jgi:glycosyltransferase involved in cell wall biosynthesis